MQIKANPIAAVTMQATAIASSAENTGLLVLENPTYPIVNRSECKQITTINRPRSLIIEFIITLVCNENSGYSPLQSA